MASHCALTPKCAPAAPHASPESARDESALSPAPAVPSSRSPPAPPSSATVSAMSSSDEERRGVQWDAGSGGRGVAVARASAHWGVRDTCGEPGWRGGRWIVVATDVSRLVIIAADHICGYRVRDAACMRRDTYREERRREHDDFERAGVWAERPPVFISTLLATPDYK